MNRSILIIDDEPHIQQAIKRLLHREGYDVHLASSGPEALEVLARTDVAVVICDQRMPGMSGAQVLAESVKLRPEAYRITISGYSDLKALQASINDGQVDHFLLKPWDDGYLLKVVQEGLRAYQLIRENRRLEELTRRQKAELESWNRQLEQQVRERTRELQSRNQNLLALQQRLEKSLRDTVGVLASMLEAYSPNLAIHSKRVAELAHMLASRLGLADSDLRDVEFAARLHDIGKISQLCAADRNTTRQARLRQAERTERHPEAGHAILSRVEGFENVALAVRHQHEHFDGTGHPERLKGADIPVGARVIAVADAYDNAVFSPLTPTKIAREEGRRVLLHGRGKRFDPFLVDLLLAHLSQVESQAGNDSEVELSPSQVREGMVLSRPLRSFSGLLLLPAGTRLTAELLERVRNLSEVNPLLASVFVKCTPELRPGDQEPTASPASSTGSQPAQADPRAESPCPGESPRAMDPASSPSRKRVLVVDDVALMCNALKRTLHPAGLEVVTASNGREALRLARESDFDVVITDLMMPEMSGEELIGHLSGLIPDLPCIILTGNATTQEVVRAAKLPNVAGVLVKPWNHERLLQTVAAAVARRHQAAKGATT